MAEMSQTLAAHEQSGLLKRREEELARVQRIGGVAGFDIDLTGDPVGARSPEYQLLHGLAPETVYETHADWLARIHPEDRARADAAFRMAIATGGPYQHEYRIIRPIDGALRWIAAKGEVELDESGRAVRLVGAHIDVTERKEAELALAESEARYALALDAGEMGSWRWDLRTDAVRWDRRYFHLVGLDPDADSASTTHVPKLLHPDERERAARDMRKIREGAWEVYWSEFRFVINGAVRWIATRARLERLADGTPAALHGLSWDVTDERENAERLNGLVRELDHRVKNTLALVQSIANQTLVDADVARARTKLQERLRALAAAHDLLTRAHWRDIPLSALAEAIVASQPTGRIVYRGPALRVDPAVAVSLSLALQEFVANAVAHGALSAPTGAVDLSWSPCGPERAEIVWREAGGPSVAAPAREGFGLRLIRTAFAAEGGPAFDFAPEGLRCVLRAAVLAENC